MTKEVITNSAKELKILEIWDKLTPEQRVKILKNEGYVQAVYKNGKLQSFRFVNEKLINLVS